MTPLKPCPFCGHEGEHRQIAVRSWAQCKRCGSSSEIWNNRPAAIRQWNTRIDEADPERAVSTALPNALLERCEEQLRRCGPNWGRYPFEAVVIPAADLRCLLDAVG